MTDFTPRTGAYWRGWTDALDGEPERPPDTYEDWAIADYADGYREAAALEPWDPEEACRVLNEHRKTGKGVL